MDAAGSASLVEIEEAITHLEEGIRKLKVQYDMFFLGASKRPPTELRAQVDRLIRRFQNAQFRKYSERFHFNTLVGRYNSFVELWNKQLRAQEEGRDPFNSAAMPRQEPQKPTPAPAAAATNGEKIFYKVRISDPNLESENLRSLFEHYLAARSQKDGAPPKLTLDSFAAQLTRQIDSLKASSGCSAVEFRLTDGDSRVTIKVRPAPSTEEVVR